MAPKWQLVETYFETCNCDVVCPCVFLSAPTTGECTVLVGWHIERGSFDHVPLDGLNVALAVHAPGRMAQVKWKAPSMLMPPRTRRSSRHSPRSSPAKRAGILRGWSPMSAGVVLCR